MNIIRKLLSLEDREYERKAQEADRRIEAATEAYEGKVREIQDRQNHQTLRRQSNDRVMSTWGGAMRMLRNNE